ADAKVDGHTLAAGDHHAHVGVGLEAVATLHDVDAPTIPGPVIVERAIVIDAEGGARAPSPIALRVQDAPVRIDDSQRLAPPNGPGGNLQLRSVAATARHFDGDLATRPALHPHYAGDVVDGDVVARERTAIGGLLA